MTKTVDFKAKINALNENINGLKFEYDLVKKAQANNEAPSDSSRFYCIMPNYLVNKIYKGVETRRDRYVKDFSDYNYDIEFIERINTKNKPLLDEGWVFVSKKQFKVHLINLLNMFNGYFTEDEEKEKQRLLKLLDEDIYSFIDGERISTDAIRYAILDIRKEITKLENIDEYYSYKDNLDNNSKITKVEIARDNKEVESIISKSKLNETKKKLRHLNIGLK